jgi:hypothetical protein
MVALASLWRESTADAVYVFPNFPIAGTAGMPGRYTGTYGEVRADWTVTHTYTFARRIKSGIACSKKPIGGAARG